MRREGRSVRLVRHSFGDPSTSDAPPPHKPRPPPPAKPQHGVLAPVGSGAVACQAPLDVTPLLGLPVASPPPGWWRSSSSSVTTAGVPSMTAAWAGRPDGGDSTRSIGSPWRRRRWPSPPTAGRPSGPTPRPDEVGQAPSREAKVDVAPIRDEDGPHTDLDFALSQLEQPWSIRRGGFVGVTCHLRGADLPTGPPAGDPGGTRVGARAAPRRPRTQPRARRCTSRRTRPLPGTVHSSSIGTGPNRVRGHRQSVSSAPSGTEVPDSRPPNRPPRSASSWASTGPSRPGLGYCLADAIRTPVPSRDVQQALL